MLRNGHLCFPKYLQKIECWRTVATMYFSHTLRWMSSPGNVSRVYTDGPAPFVDHLWLALNHTHHGTLWHIQLNNTQTVQLFTFLLTFNWFFIIKLCFFAVRYLLSIQDPPLFNFPSKGSSKGLDILNHNFKFHRISPFTTHFFPLGITQKSSMG